jgi:hypothetical protein
MKILIAGDSWGLGEWGWLAKSDVWVTYYNTLKGVDWPECPPFGFHTTLPAWVQLELTTAGFDLTTFGDDIGYYTVLHTGLQQYFEDAGHIVTNISRAGESINHAICQLSQLTLTDYDHIIWFQTDPLRNLAPYTNFEYEFRTIDSLLYRQQELLKQSYYELNSLGKKINCLGGCSKLAVELLGEFNNLHPVINSVPEFLLPHYIHPIIWHSAWHKKINRLFDIDSLDKLVVFKKLQDSLIEEKELFWPDGGHPNRHGHKIIFDYLIDRLI